jgi:hypothetical protein
MGSETTLTNSRDSGNDFRVEETGDGLASISDDVK